MPLDALTTKDEKVQSAARPSKACRSSRLGFALPDDRYIPIRVEDVIVAMARDDARFGAVSGALLEVGEAMERVVDQEAAGFRRELERRYDRFNPARETIALDPDASLGPEEACRELWAMVDYLLDKANYDRLDEDQISAAIAAANSYGIRIRVVPERVGRLEIYVRGRAEEKRRRRTVRAPIKGEEIDVELYRRLAVVFQEAGNDHVALKLFREIPVADVEALLPHAEVAMSPIDRLKIIGGGMGALGGLATKVVQVLIGGSMALTQFLWAGILGFLGLSVKSFMGYRRAKHARTSQMTHNLYYQNVANNSGVLDLLVGSIAHEELKEVTLAYAVLACDVAREVRDTDALERVVETWLESTFDVDIDFDGPDAIESLDRFDLWADRAAWRVVDPPEAIARLDRHWSTRRTKDYHLEMIRRRARAAPPCE